MSNALPTSIKAIMMKTLKKKFGSFDFWERIEADIAMFCADLPEPVNDSKKRDLVNQLKQIKTYLQGHEVIEKKLLFLDQEIERYENTSTITLYEEEEDCVPFETIEMYARLGSGTEGVVGIHQPLNYSQLCKLTNGVFKKTGLIKFYISRERTVYGKIVAEIYEHQQKIPIATLVESIKKNKETGDPLYRKIRLFGQKIDRKRSEIIREIPIPFHVYRFITEDNIDMVLMTPMKCDIGDYIMTGVLTECNDYKMLTESAKLPTKLPYFFVQIARNRIIKYRNHGELFVRIKQLGITKKRFYNYPFAIKKDAESFVLLQPDWYKQLIWSWLVHQPKGIFNNYPLHLLQLGERHSGKSLLLNCLHAKSKEAKKVFSGSSSTLKHLVPSFKYKPAKLGYLAETNRFAFCDEFLRCLINLRSQQQSDSKREETVAILNDLLEWQKREAGSGVSKVNVNMTSRLFATTNPVKGIKNVTDLIKLLDPSFMSRLLVYYQTKEHVKLIRDSDDEDLKPFKFDISTNIWAGILDYLHSFSAIYDMKIVKKIHSEAPKVLNETLKDHYDARHKHHIECLIDGIIKTRCILEKDRTFKAKDEDYLMLKKVWFKLLSSWIMPKQINEMDIEDRIFYLPESSQTFYWRIVDLKREIHRTEIKELALSLMTKNEFYECYQILIEHGLLIESDGMIKPHLMRVKN